MLMVRAKIYILTGFSILLTLKSLGLDNHRSVEDNMKTDEEEEEKDILKVSDNISLNNEARKVLVLSQDG